MRSDRELLARYQRGSEEAFVSFYDRHCRGLYLFLLSLLQSREAAEELLQEIFLGLVGRLDSLDVRENMKPYLFTSARNSAVDWLRRENRFRRAMEKRREDPFFRGPESAAKSFESDGPDVAELNKLLHQLPLEQREAVVLKELIGMTFREISALTKAPENTVVSRHRYAMAKLRTMILQRDGSDHGI